MKLLTRSKYCRECGHYFEFRWQAEVDWEKLRRNYEAYIVWQNEWREHYGRYHWEDARLVKH